MLRLTRWSRQIKTQQPFASRGFISSHRAPTRQDCFTLARGCAAEKRDAQERDDHLMGFVSPQRTSAL